MNDYNHIWSKSTHHYIATSSSLRHIVISFWNICFALKRPLFYSDSEGRENVQNWFRFQLWWNNGRFAASAIMFDINCVILVLAPDVAHVPLSFDLIHRHSTILLLFRYWKFMYCFIFSYLWSVYINFVLMRVLSISSISGACISIHWMQGMLAVLTQYLIIGNCVKLNLGPTWKDTIFLD